MPKSYTTQVINFYGNQALVSEIQNVRIEDKANSKVENGKDWLFLKYCNKKLVLHSFDEFGRACITVFTRHGENAFYVGGRGLLSGIRGSEQYLSNVDYVNFENVFDLTKTRRIPINFAEQIRMSISKELGTRTVIDPEPVKAVIKQVESRFVTSELLKKYTQNPTALQLLVKNLQSKELSYIHEKVTHSTTEQGFVIAEALTDVIKIRENEFNNLKK